MVLQITAVVIWVLLVVAVVVLIRSRGKKFWPALGKTVKSLLIWTVSVALLAATSVGIYVGVGIIQNGQEIDHSQEELNPFYNQFEGTTGEPGELLAQEKIAGIDLPGATTWRILYRSTGPKGESTIASGMVFVPDAPGENRMMIGWAHPTSGLGDQCAPSRTADHLRDTYNWLPEMLGKGWVVAATDYSGLGTPGVSYYLDGQSESADVAYSVVAAQQIENVNSGDRWAIYGHSQGGHSALWTAERAKELLPDMELVAVAAAAPAAELNKIMEAQWPTVVGWVIGPQVSQGLPKLYPDMTMDGIVTAEGQADMEPFAMDCIDTSAILGLARQGLLDQKFFASNPADNTGWFNAMEDQTPQPILDLPVMVIQSLADQIVLAWPNAVLQQKWCDAGSQLEMMWLGKISHQDTAVTAGPSVVSWLEQRINGVPMQSNCSVPAPVSVPAEFQ